MTDSLDVAPRPRPPRRPRDAVPRSGPPVTTTPGPTLWC